MKLLNFIIEFITSLFKPKLTVEAPVITQGTIPPVSDIKPATEAPTTPQSIPQATLTRIKDDGLQTTGRLVISKQAGYGTHEITFDSLELPWKNNQHNISCIPKGTYQCSLQPFHETHHYELANVPNRTGIFIHAGNFFKDTMGCILLGATPQDINGDGEVDLLKTREAVSAMEAFFNGQPFTLTIK